MKVVLVNDDGIDAKGIQLLAQTLTKKHEVVIVAPDVEQSGRSHAITAKAPLIVVEEREAGQKVPAYRVEGSPADCVAVACCGLLLAPDVIVSGINCGFNLGADIFYSGTVSAAMEGALLGVNSIAISAASFDEDVLRVAATAVSHLLCALQQDKQGPILYNINVPISPIGAACASLSPQSCTNAMGTMEQRRDPRGRMYYWRPLPHHTRDQYGDTDREWIQRKYITITPLNIDLTKYEKLATARILSSVLMTT